MESRAAAEVLWEAWQGGARIDALPVAIRPRSRHEAYGVQAHLEDRGTSPIFGWKIAATSAAGQAHIGVDGPLAGRILHEMLVPEGSEVSLTGNAMRVAEPEFVFRMGDDLPPRAAPYDEATVLAAVAGLHIGIELPDSRYADFGSVGAPQLIADDACGHQYALGPEAPDAWRRLDLASHTVHATVGDRYERDGIGANVLGDPRTALTWLVNELSGLGLSLGAGQYVTTGTCMTPLELEPGDRVVADFGVLGHVSLGFVP